MRPLRRARWCATAAAVLLVACGGPSNHASNSSAQAEQKATARPCGLLSNDDVVGALSAPVTSSTPLAQAACTYMLPSASKQPGEVDVVVSDGRKGQNEWQVDQSDPVNSIGGVGDEAWTITNSQYHKIGVRRGDLYVFVTVVQDDPSSPTVDTLRTLAQDVLGHIS